MKISNFSNIISQDINNIIIDELPWEKFSGSKIVITGASGLIGSYLTRALLSLHTSGKVQQPIQVVGIVRNIAKAKNRFADLDEDINLTFIECNLCNPENLKVDADWFIHAASHASPKHYNIDPIGTLAPNVIGTYHLLKLAQAAGAKSFVFISSGEIYGDVGMDTDLTEKNYGTIDPSLIRSSYAESKRMGENICISWMHQFGLPIHIIRPFNTYGPGLDLKDGRVFVDFAADVITGRDIHIKGDGISRRSFCYISDAIRGIFHVILRGDAGESYNVANPDGDLSILELANLMANIFPEKNLQIRQDNANKNKNLSNQFKKILPDVKKLERLGWKAKISSTEGFKRMVNSY